MKHRPLDINSNGVKGFMQFFPLTIFSRIDEFFPTWVRFLQRLRSRFICIKVG